MNGAAADRSALSCFLCTAENLCQRSGTVGGLRVKVLGIVQQRKTVCIRVCLPVRMFKQRRASVCPLDISGSVLSHSLLLICLLKLPADADDIQGCLSQEVRPWVCCAPQGDMIYDPSWHHPPPLIPHYSKMVFETGQFDDAED